MELDYGRTMIIYLLRQGEEAIDNATLDLKLEDVQIPVSPWDSLILHAKADKAVYGYTKEDYEWLTDTQNIKTIMYLPAIQKLYVGSLWIGSAIFTPINDSCESFNLHGRLMVDTRYDFPLRDKKKRLQLNNTLTSFSLDIDGLYTGDNVRKGEDYR